MSEQQQSTMDKCPTCGTTVIKFDPPLVFKAEEMCGELKVGTYTANGFPAPVCNLAKGHEGEHCALMEWTEHWESPRRSQSMVDEIPAAAVESAAQWFSRYFGASSIRKRDREYATQMLAAVGPLLIAEGRRRQAADMLAARLAEATDG